MGQIAVLQYSPEPALIRRVNQYRAITVSGLPKAGHLASEVTSPLMPRIRDFERSLPPGYRLEIVGELKEQIKGQLQSLEALVDAGILRIRPVLITVGATVLALFPLALHGGPLWEALGYAQIGGLTLATVVTLFIVPVFYAIFVLDLKIVRWEEQSPSDQTSEPSSDLVCETDR